MANYRGHMRGGFVAFALIILFAIPQYHPSALTTLEWLLFAIAGSLFPDVDIKSMGQKYFYRLILLLIVLLAYHHKYQHLAAISILSLVPLLVKHRGLFHQPWFIVALPVSIWYLSTLYHPVLREALWMGCLFFIGGAASHLLLDMR